MKKKADKERSRKSDEELHRGEETEQHEHADEQGYDPVDHIAHLEREREEAIEKYKRSLADFQNYQRRSIQSEQQAREQAVAGVVKSLLPVFDNFELALDQDLSKINVEQFTQGMRIVRDELHKALRLHGLSRIEVSIGDPFDPRLHEAVAHVPGEGVEPGHVSNITQQGYMLGERVLRATKVTVAPPTQPDDSGDHESNETSTPE